MGCGASTFPRDEAGGGGGISYLYVNNPLHRHSPWRCKGTRSASDGNPSSKKLLAAATVDEDGGDSVGRRSVSADPVSPKNIGGFMKEPPVQTMIENVPDLKREVEEERPVGGDPDHDNGKDERRGVGEDHTSHADEDSDNEHYGLLFPRSPSFRYYCMPHDDNNDSDSSSSSSSLDGMKAPIGIGKTDEVLTPVESNKSCNDHDNAGNASRAKLSSSETLSSSKKSRKSAARRLRVALSKRNPGTGMKNMLSVTSCSPRRAPQVAS